MSERVRTGSWIDHLIDWIDRLPGPAVAFYVVVYAVTTITMHIAIWTDGVVESGTLDLQWLSNPIFIVLSLGWIHYLKRVTRRSLDGFEPLLHDQPQQFARLENRMLLMSKPLVMGITVVIGGLMIAGVVADPAIVYEGLDSPIFYAIAPPLLIFAYTTLVIALAYTIGLLRSVNEAFRLVTTVDVVHPRPLFALTNITVQSGLIWILVVNFVVANYVFVENANSNTEILDLSLAGIGLLIALASFLLPLRGIHRRLDDTKAALLEENAAAVNRTRVKLYAALDRDAHAEVDSIDKGLSSLLRLRDELETIKTWPWKPGTLRNFSSAIVLPILLWVTQQVLSRYV